MTQNREQVEYEEHTFNFETKSVVASLDLNFEYLFTHLERGNYHFMIYY